MVSQGKDCLRIEETMNSYFSCNVWEAATSSREYTSLFPELLVVIVSCEVELFQYFDKKDIHHLANLISVLESVTLILSEVWIVLDKLTELLSPHIKPPQN